MHLMQYSTWCKNPKDDGLLNSNHHEDTKIIFVLNCCTCNLYLVHDHHPCVSMHFSCVIRKSYKAGA
jgi:hypothetical protein